MKSNKIRLSVQQYADLLGLTRQAILYRIKNELQLPDVKLIEKIGKAYILTVTKK